MAETIRLKDAAKLAGLSHFEMRDAAHKNGLEPRPRAYSVGTMKLDKDLLFAWLVENGGDAYRLREEEAEIRYAEWLAENGEFLRRFLAEHAQN